MATFHRKIDPTNEHISDTEFLNEIKRLILHFYQNDQKYRRWIALIYDIRSIKGLNYFLQKSDLSELPYIPSSALKLTDLKTITPAEVSKVMYSSGTTSNLASKIFLDTHTAKLMAERLRIDTIRCIGDQRRPLFIVDEQEVFRDRQSFVARGAAIAGLLKFGNSINFLFKGNQLDEHVLNNLVSLKDKNFLMVGTTVNVWTKLIPAIARMEVDFSKGTLVHGGGWKLLEKEAVDNTTFKKRLAEVSKLTRSINFFGMVEQLGSVSYECSEGKFHTPSCTRYIIRSPKTGRPVRDDSAGILQVNSLLPASYPGALVLTDDLGKLVNNHSCACGNQLPIFEYVGRIKVAEQRGCGAANV